VLDERGILCKLLLDACASLARLKAVMDVLDRLFEAMAMSRPRQMALM